MLATASRPSCTDADNDPLNKTDPLGLRPGPAFERELTGVAVFDGCPAGQILQVYAPNANGTNWSPFISGYCREPVGGNSGANPLRLGLEIAGFFPVIGEPADGILCGWGVVGQDWGNAGFDCAAMIPFAGWGSRAAKWTRTADAAADAARVGDYVDLVPAARRRHILDGEVRADGSFGGGHRAGTGFPDKSEFPARWSDDEIIHHVSDVASDPSHQVVRTQGRDVFVRGTRDGQEIEVLIRNGEIWTAYPVGVPRNPG